MITKAQQVGKKKQKKRQRIPLNGDTCYFCEGKPATDKHEPFRGTANRQLCIQYGIIYAICDNCHRIITLNPFCDMDLELRQAGKQYFDTTYPHLDFVSVFNTRWE